MKIYCKLCDKVQPVIIDNCRDAKTNEPFQDIVCAECRLVIASGTDIQSADTSVTWGVDWGKAGDIPCVSIIKRLPDGGVEVLAVEYGPIPMERHK